MKSGQQLFDSGTQETPKPFTTLRKACPGNQKRECLYRITGKNERKLYEFTADEMIMVSYTYQTAVVELP